MCYAESPTVQEANSYQASSAALGWPRDGDCYLMHKTQSITSPLPTHMHTCIFSTYKLFTMETILATAFGRVIDIQRGEADELTKASASLSEAALEGGDTLDLILLLLSEFYSLSYVHTLGQPLHWFQVCQFDASDFNSNVRYVKKRASQVFILPPSLSYPLQVTSPFWYTCLASWFDGYWRRIRWRFFVKLLSVWWRQEEKRAN